MWGLQQTCRVGRGLFNLLEVTVTTFRDAALVHEALEYQGDVNEQKCKDIKPGHLS